GARAPGLRARRSPQRASRGPSGPSGRRASAPRPPRPDPRRARRAEHLVHPGLTAGRERTKAPDAPRCVGGLRQTWSAAAAGAQRGERLGKDRVAVLLRATLLHVGQVRLVRLVAHGRGRVLPVLPRGKAAARAVPRRGRLVGALLGEARTRLVAVRAPVRDPHPWCALAALGLPHRARADARAPDRTSATSHDDPLSRSRAGSV